MNVDEHTAIYYIYIKSLNFNSISSLIFKIEVILNVLSFFVFCIKYNSYFVHIPSLDFNEAMNLWNSSDKSVLLIWLILVALGFFSVFWNLKKKLRYLLEKFYLHIIL